MVWGKAGSKTLTVANATISLTGLPTSNFNQFLQHSIPNGSESTEPRIKINNDSAGHANRMQRDGENDSVANSRGDWVTSVTDAADDNFIVTYMSNFDGKEKIGMNFTVQNSGGTATPRRRVVTSTYTDGGTNAKVTRVDATDTATDKKGVGANFSILGSDISTQEGRPTNIQSGSRLEETDTRKIYHYGTDKSQNFANVLSTYAPQFFLKLDEGTGTTLTNSGSNSGYTASVTLDAGTPVWDTGIGGANKAVKFTANTSGAYIGHTNLPTESTGDNFTMGFTFKVPTNFSGGDANHHHLWKWYNNGLGFWQMNMTNDGYIGSAWYNGGWQHALGTTNSHDNAWHTFFITCTSGSSLIGYLDGVQEFSATANRSGYAGNDVDWIGHNGGNGTISYDNAFFKNTVLTASEISSLHTLLITEGTSKVWKEEGT